MIFCPVAADGGQKHGRPFVQVHCCIHPSRMERRRENYGIRWRTVAGTSNFLTALGFDPVDSTQLRVTANASKHEKFSACGSLGDFTMIRVTKIVASLLLLVFTVLAMPSAAPAQVAVGLSIHIGPPALPVYPQPVCPAPGYIWTPGYWAYGPDGYYWVPGTWVMAPTPGFLWTPGYWGFVGGAYLWHAGYWGPHVGFYGGINYGFGYAGVGFVGGEWRGGVFHYNTAVTNVNTTIIHTTYVNRVVVNNTVVNHVSFNGGPGGIQARPNAAEQAAMRDRHVQATAMQTQHEQMARNDHSLLASVNHGRPAIAATSRPGAFKGQGVVGAGNRPNVNADRQMDRPPSARTNNSPNANRPNTANAHSGDRPENAHGNQGYQNPQNHNEPNNAHNNNNRPNNQQSHENRPSESRPNESHRER